MCVVSQFDLHGWEITVILQNFRKTKLSKSTIFFLFFLNSISTYTDRQKLRTCSPKKLKQI